MGCEGRVKAGDGSNTTPCMAAACERTTNAKSIKNDDRKHQKKGQKEFEK